MPPENTDEIILDRVSAGCCTSLKAYIERIGVNGSLTGQNYSGKIAVTEYHLLDPVFAARSRSRYEPGAPSYTNDQGQTCYYSDGFDVWLPHTVQITRLEWEQTDSVSEPCRTEWVRVEDAAEHRAQVVKQEMETIIANFEQEMKTRWQNRRLEACGSNQLEAGTQFNELIKEEVNEEFQKLIEQLQEYPFAEDHPSPILDCTKCHSTITTTGLVGDIIEVDLSQTTYEEFEFEPGQAYEGPEVPEGHTSPATSGGYVAQLDEWKKIFRTEKKFWFIPLETGTTSFCLSAIKDGQRTEVGLQIDTREGYSTSGNAKVTFKTGRLDAYRQQQRLKYFGFPGKAGYTIDQKKCGPPTESNESKFMLTVDGRSDDTNVNSNWARGLFVSCVNGGQGLVKQAKDDGITISQFSDPTQYQKSQRLMNAENAPFWIDIPLNGLGYQVKDGDSQFERWSTSWALEVLETASAALTQLIGLSPPNQSFTMNAASLRIGGPTPCHGGHETGLQIDIDTPLRENKAEPLDPPFYRIHEIQGNKYIAAQTPDDAVGDEHIVVQNQSGEYTAAFFDADLEPPVGALPHSYILDLTTKTNDRSTRISEDVATLKSTLAGIAEFLVDNPGIYDHEVVETHIDIFAGLQVDSGARVDSIFYNDPRMWTLENVMFQPQHYGHFHVNVRPPE